MKTVALVGYGYWGPNLLRNYIELQGAWVQWVCDSDPEALKRVATRYPSVPCSSDYQQVLDDATVDAVVLATPISSHFPLAKQALLAGKHVFVEKPLAGSTAEAKELVASGRGQRSDSHGRPHLRLQPSRATGQADHRLRRVGRHLLRHLHASEPGPSPEGRQRDLGPSPARPLHTSLLVGRDAQQCVRDREGLHQPRRARCGLHQCDLPLGSGGRNAGRVALSGQAAADGGRGQ